MSSLGPDIEALRRNSRRAAGISLVGGVVVLAVLGGTAWQVNQLQARRAALAAEVKSLEGTKSALLQTIEAEQERRRLALQQLAQDNTKAAEKILAPAKSASATSAVSTPSAAETVRVSTPRVYFQIRGADQIGAYKTCKQALPMRYRVLPYEVVARGPDHNEVRYFHADDAVEAEKLAQAVQQCLHGRPVQLTYLGQYPSVNPLHFEVWLTHAAE